MQSLAMNTERIEGKPGFDFGAPRQVEIGAVATALLYFRRGMLL